MAGKGKTAAESVRPANGAIIGYEAIIPAMLTGDFAGIGMGAILSIRSEVDRGFVGAEGAVVKQEHKIPETVVFAGNPAKKIRDLSQKERDLWDYAGKLYADLAHK